jgi:hypothetical protein
MKQLIASAIRSPHLVRAKALAQRAAAIKTGPKGDLAAAGLAALADQRFDAAREAGEQLQAIADTERDQLVASAILALADRQPDRATELAEQLLEGLNEDENQ